MTGRSLSKKKKNLDCVVRDRRCKQAGAGERRVYVAGPSPLVGINSAPSPCRDPSGSGGVLAPRPFPRAPQIQGLLLPLPGPHAGISTEEAGHRAAPGSGAPFLEHFKRK